MLWKAYTHFFLFVWKILHLPESGYVRVVNGDIRHDGVGGPNDEERQDHQHIQLVTKYDSCQQR